MSLIDDLAEATERNGRMPRAGCSVCKALAVMGPDEGESLQQALKSKVGAKPLSIILQKHGVSVGVPSIHLHRTEGHTP